MSIPPDFASDSFAALPDGKYSITSQLHQTEGLEPKNKGLSPDKAVIAVTPDATEDFLTWSFVRRGVTLDKKSVIVTFELNSKPKHFLSYDFVKKSVVLKDDSQPAWIVTQFSGGRTQFTIAPLTEPTQFLTWVEHGEQVKLVAKYDSPIDIPKQVWNIAA